jgi:hypothetical protein
VIQRTSPVSAQVGDRLVVGAHLLRGVAFDGEIVAVLGADGRPPYAVRWFASRRVTLMVPGPDARVAPLEPVP